MCCCNQKCIKNIRDHSNAYIIVLLGYGICLYELWSYKENEKEKESKKSIILTILNFLPFIFGLCDILGLQILNMCRNKLRMEQENLLFHIEDIYLVLHDSLENPNDLNLTFLIKFFENISLIKRLKKDLEEKLENKNKGKEEEMQKKKKEGEEKGEEKEEKGKKEEKKKEKEKKEKEKEEKKKEKEKKEKEKEEKEKEGKQKEKEKKEKEKEEKKKKKEKKIEKEKKEKEKKEGKQKEKEREKEEDEKEVEEKEVEEKEEEEKKEEDQKINISPYEKVYIENKKTKKSKKRIKDP